MIKYLLPLSLLPQIGFTACEGVVQFDNGLEYRVEIVADDASRARGLMFRQSMNADQGMLFIYPSDSERQFWMKNTYLPLDILFFKNDGAFNNVQIGAKPHDLTPLPGFGAAILEINAGQYANESSNIKNLRFTLNQGAVCSDIVTQSPMLDG